MKYVVYINTLIVFFIFFSLAFLTLTAFAATSNTVTTKVGNPSTQSPVSNPGTSTPQNASSCPIPQGVVTCGTKTTPVNGPLGVCGHCDVGYGAANTAKYCSFSGNDMAIDIQTYDLQEVKLPQIDGHNIRWTYDNEYPGSPATIIFNGVDTVTADTYAIQFHHVHPGSGNKGTYMSGDKAANTCSGCGAGHVHVQLAKGNSWLDATQYLCK